MMLEYWSLWFRANRDRNWSRLNLSLLQITIGVAMWHAKSVFESCKEQMQTFCQLFISYGKKTPRYNFTLLHHYKLQKLQNDCVFISPLLYSINCDISAIGCERDGHCIAFVVACLCNHSLSAVCCCLPMVIQIYYYCLLLCQTSACQNWYFGRQRSYWYERMIWKYLKPLHGQCLWNVVL